MVNKINKILITKKQFTDTKYERLKKKTIDKEEIGALL